MRLFPAIVVGGIALAVFQGPHVFGDARSAAADALAPQAHASAPSQRVYDRLCPLFEVWTDLDGTGRAATTKTLSTLTRKQYARTTDPALRAFLSVVPFALGPGSDPKTVAAQELINRECTAHRH